MVEKILKNTYVNPKIELTQSDYNRLVELARMKAKKIAERARELYENEGIVKIQFDGRIYNTKCYDNDGVQHYQFECDIPNYKIYPITEYTGNGKTLFVIPEETRRRIANKVGRYVEEVFEARFGEHLTNLNEIEKLKGKQLHYNRMFLMFTIVGWLAAVAMLLVAIL